MLKLFLSFAFALLPLASMAVDLDRNVPEGWAIYPESNVEGITGGGDGDVVTVDNLSDLTKYCGDSKPYIILIKGTITATDPVTVKSNKTLIGLKGSFLNGVGININGASNIILRNLNISGSADGVGAHHTTHLWVDHCSLWDNSDGLCDITNQSSFCSVSWCKFYYVNQTEHRLCALIGSGAGDHPEDFGYLKVTYNHNWFGTKCNERQPRIMYGRAHVYNDFYNCSGNLYCIGIGSYGSALVENNYFKDVQNPHYLMYNVYCYLTANNNIYDNCTGKKESGKLGERDVVVEGKPEYTCAVTEFSKAPYLYNMDAAKDIPSMVQSGAGQQGDYAKIGFMPLPGQGCMDVCTTPTLKWYKGTEVRNATSYIVYLGTTTDPVKVATVTKQQYTPSTLKANTVYYWRIDAVTPSGTVEGKLWRFKTGSGNGSSSETETAENQAPNVSLTAPANNAVYSAAPAEITLQASANDADGSIWKVEFYNDETLLNSATHSPYQYVWKNVPEGTYTIKAIATDNLGLASEPATITVKVQQPKTLIFDNTSAGAWTEASLWTPTQSPTDVDTAIVRNGEVKVAADVRAKTLVEEGGTFRITSSIAVRELHLQGGMLRSYTSTPQQRLSFTSLLVEADSKVQAGSTTASQFVIRGSYTGSGNLTKDGVGLLSISSTASNYTGRWTLTQGNMSFDNDNAMGSNGIDVTGENDTLTINNANQTGSVTVGDGDKVVLNADFTVNHATLAGKKLPAGTYTADDYPDELSGPAKLIVLEGDDMSAVTSVDAESAVRVYPNPTSGVLNVVVPNGAAVATLYNQLGVVVAQYVVDGNATIDLSSSSKGVYFLQIQTENGTEVIKVVKQ